MPDNPASQPLAGEEKSKESIPANALAEFETVKSAISGASAGAAIGLAFGGPFLGSIVGGAVGLLLGSKVGQERLASVQNRPSDHIDSGESK